MKHLTPACYGLLVIMVLFSTTLSAQISVEVVGPNTATIGQTKDYTVTWRNGGSTISPLTTGTFLWWAMGGTPATGTNASGSVLWTAAGPKIVGFEYTTPTNYYAHDYLVTVSDVTPVQPSVSVTTVKNCGNTVITRSTSPPTGITWYWQTSSSGTSTAQSGSSVTYTSAGSLYLRARNSSGTWSTAQNLGSITVVSTPPTVPATANHQDVISDSATPVSLSVSAVSGATGYRWYTTSTGGTAISGPATSSYTPSLATTTSFYVESLIDNCASTSRKEVTGYVHPKPVISMTNNGIATMGENVTLSLNYSYNQYQWKRNGVNISGATASTYQTNMKGSYSVSVKKGNSSFADPVTPALLVANLANQDTLNYIISETILIPGITNADDIDPLPVEKVTQSVTYFDGLGRPLQAITTQGSPLKKDIVQNFAYDSIGREAVKYLPYVASINDGRYKTGFVDKEKAGYTSSPQYQFYNNASTTIAQDNAPYSETIFEVSPLNRPDKNFGTGADWQTNNKSIQHGYLVNRHGTGAGEEKIIFWKVNSSGLPVRAAQQTGYVLTGGYYPTGQLSIKSTKDEQGNEVRVYTNKSGQVILRKVQVLSSSDLNSATQWALTYYIYDNLYNLRYVLQPELSKVAHASDTTVMNSTRLTNLAFQYTYDTRKRMTMKRVPGSGVVYMVYDQRDRLVLAQDANQRSNKYWSFTKYDAFNRPILTGIHTADSVLTQAKMQRRVNQYYANFGSNSGTWYETSGSTVHGYTNTSYPLESNANNYMSVTYYDNYDFISLLSGSYTYVDENLSKTVNGIAYNQPDANFTRLKGQVTGTRIKVLDGGIAGGSNWLNTVTYYDDRYRVIQVISDNAVGGKDYTSSLYDFTGKVLKTLTTHNKASESTDITRSFMYDHAGRLLRTWHRIDDEDSVLLAQNQYNELGQLIDKKLHSRDNLSFARNTAYRYTIRGWLSSINDPELNVNGLFSFALKYNDPTIAGTSAQYNGNISQTTWRTAGQEETSYAYAYDGMSRLTEASYYSASNPLADYTEAVTDGGNSGYDLNGNIKKMQRYGKRADNSFGLIDNLTYNYVNGAALTGNRLMSVTDGSANALGFNDGNASGNDYDYDDNGNLKTDKNKGISGSSGNVITYNVLNLPERIQKSATQYITYTYDAAGRKLAQSLTDGIASKVTLYAGAFLYQNDTLKFISHEEGRILPDTLPSTDYDWEYQYDLKDHLGNVRLTFSEKSTTTTHTTSLEESSNAAFVNYTNRNNFSLGKRTGSYSQKLTGGSNSQIGLAKSFEVNAGDAVDLEVYAKYESFDEEGTSTNLNTLITSLISAFSLNPSGGTGLDGQGAYNAFNGYFAAGALVDPNDIDDDAPPKAFLNYILFDENFVPVDFGFDQVSTDAEQVGALPNVAHDRLSLHLKVKQKGYLYVYLSNENPVLANVYFDDLTITHHTGIEQSDDYYAFGLAFNSYSRENSTPNKYKFGGKEEQTELALNTVDWGWRQYDPAIGRWNVIDQWAEKYHTTSSYAFVQNNPISNREIDGRYFEGKDEKKAARIERRAERRADKLERKADRIEARGGNSGDMRARAGELRQSGQDVRDMRNDQSTQYRYAKLGGKESKQLGLAGPSTTLTGQNTRGDNVVTMFTESRMGSKLHESRHGGQNARGEYNIATAAGYGVADEVSAYRAEFSWNATLGPFLDLSANPTQAQILQAVLAGKNPLTTTITSFNAITPNLVNSMADPGMVPIYPPKDAQGNLIIPLNVWNSN